MNARRSFPQPHTDTHLAAAMMEALVPQRKSRRTLWKFARAAVVAALALAVPLTMASCASERPPRSFVQPNVIKKADLDGTFYYVQTVTDAPPSNGAMFIGLATDLMKIRFDVQENYLYATRAFEQIEGSEDAAEADRLGYKGQPLAAWRISHFDIIRDYNSTTGEQTNRIIESTERPWMQREFIRVDWSMNLVTDFTGLGLSMFFDGIRAQPISYWESDPSKKDGLHMEHVAEAKGGFKAGEMVYLDVTNMMVADPMMRNIEGYGSFPTCFFYYTQDDCASQKVKVRHAFSKIDPTHAYEPLPWDGKKMKMFGQWDVGLRRLSYNREYGVTNSGFIRHAARFNIWTQDSYETQTKLHGDKDLVHNRTIPYYASGSRAITYNNDARFPDGYSDFIYPPELYDDFTRIVGEWNSAFETAVKDYTGRDPDDKVFVSCHNPVAPGDHDACYEGLTPDVDSDGNVILDKQGKKIFHARQGDPRRSHIFWVNQQQNAGPLGYGPGLYDAQTGETQSGQAYIYGAAIETYSTRSRDMLLLLNNDLTADDYIAGVNVKDHVKQSLFGTGPSGGASTSSVASMIENRKSSSHARMLTERDVSAMAGAMDFNWALAFTAENGYGSLDLTSPKALKESLRDREERIYRGHFERMADDRDTRMSKLQNTAFEQMMITPERLSAVGIAGNKTIDKLNALELAMASPLRAKELEKMTADYRMKAEMLGVDFAQFDDNGMNQNLRRYLQKYNTDSFLDDGVDEEGNPVKVIGATAERLRQDLLHDIYVGVTLHEMGHNLGCRHNFRGSYDSMNYFPQYWELRTGAINHPDAGMQPKDNKLHPRYVNKPGGRITQYEMDGQIQEYQYSSIMDYGSEYYSDLQGLGLYDKAIIKFSYAGYVEVFTDVKTDAATRAKITSIHQFFDSYGLPSPLGTGSGLSAIPYHSYPDLFRSGAAGIYKREDVPFDSIDFSGQRFVDGEGRPLVPYYFCSDEFVGNLTCQRFDSGADPYEQAVDLISRYKNFYLSNNYKRDRQAFSSFGGYASRIGGRYFDMLRQQLTWYTLLRSDFTDYMARSAQFPTNAERDTNKFFVDENGWGAFTAGVALGYELLGDVLTMPQPGVYQKQTAADGSQIWHQITGNIIDTTGQPQYRTIGLLDGKYIDNTWDFDGCGYYWGEECQLRIGYMVDKQLALDFLSQSQAYFTGRDTSVDVRRYAIGYVIPFKAQLQEKIGALLSEDTASLSQTFAKVGREGNNDIFAPKSSSWLMPEDPSTKSELIDPATGFTVSLYSGVYALAAFPTTFDPSFIDNTRIFVLGNGEATAPESEILANGTTDPSELVSHGGTKRWLRVSDPLSGKSYAAYALAPQGIPVLDPRVTNPDPSNNYGVTSVPVRKDTGVRMLERLSVLADRYAAVSGLPDTDYNKVTAMNELQKFRQNIEVMRSLHKTYGYTPYMAQ